MSHHLFPFKVSFGMTSEKQITNAILLRDKLKLYEKYMMNLCVKTIGSRSSCFNAGIHNCDRELDLVPSPVMNFFRSFMSSHHHLFVLVTSLLLILNLNGFGGDTGSFKNLCVTAYETANVTTLNHKVPFTEEEG